MRDNNLSDRNILSNYKKMSRIKRKLSEKELDLLLMNQV